MQDLAHLPALVVGCAFGLAVVFGAVANRVNFCTMGAVTDLVTMGDWRRMRMWLLAIAVAIAGATWKRGAERTARPSSLTTGIRRPDRWRQT